MELLMWLGIFAVSLACLVKASDWFVKGAEKIGTALGVPSFIIGVTIVAVGTSLPELASSIAAIYAGNSEIVIGNAIGSNITNILLVIGIVAVLAGNISTKHNIMETDVPLLVGSTLVLWFLLYDGSLTLLDAIILLMGLVIFFYHTLGKKHEQEEGFVRTKVGWKTIGLVLGSSVLIYFSADYTVESIRQLSSIVGISTEIIALSLVALGTSLPEVLVSVAAARRGNAEIAIGNVIGSNIFNTFAVIGIPRFFGDIVISEDVLNFSFPMMLGVTVLFGFTSLVNGISRAEGFLLLLLYVIFIVGLFQGVNLSI